MYFCFMDLKVGDRVRFLNDKGEGVITSFSSNGWAMVEDESGFGFEHPLNELVAVPGPSKEWKKYEKVQPEISDVVVRNLDPTTAKLANDEFKVIYKNRNATTERRKGETLEVDLHIHELLDRHENMTNGEIVQVQMEHFERMLRNAEEHKINRIIFIHGVGQGVLRAEIRKLLTSFYPNCEYMDASYAEYGQGATEVRIRRN